MEKSLMKIRGYSDEKISTMRIAARKHIYSTIRYLTIKKIFNIAIAVAEMYTKKSNVMSHPFYLRIEVSPFCNLKCPGCLLGGAEVKETNPDHRSQKIMTYDLFCESIKEYLPYLIKVNLYDEGEPLLNPSLLKMIKYLHDNNVATCISTNFSIKLSEQYLNDMVGSGLDSLVIAIDGATQECYEKYRLGGDLSLVLDNIEKLVTLRKGKNSNLKIEVQFLEFEHNKHEREAVSNIAEKLGVDIFTVLEDCSPKGWVGKRFRGTEEQRRKLGCYHLWFATTINSVGEVGCCDYGEDHGMPNLGYARNYHINSLRNHPAMMKLRSSFQRKSRNLNPICHHCSQSIKK
jgi:MoaA/NifB/PqqE/SkfB family radical SAM enzyme